MRRSANGALVRVLTGALALVTVAGTAAAQDIEPRRWTHLPLGTDIIGLAYVYSDGDLLLDPAIRIEDAEVELHTGVLSYNRYFGLFGKTARVDVLLPFQSGRWEGLLNDQPASTTRDGLADPRVRFSVNFAGSPALSEAEFREYRAQNPVDTTVGAALAIGVPLGEYDSDKLINLGENRFSIRSQLGVLHTRGPWSFELSSSVFVFTDNDDFFGGSRLEQDPLGTMQAHVVRTFKSLFWVSAGIAYGFAGETTIDGQRSDDARSNLLYGASFGFPVFRTQSVRIAYIRGDTLTDTGTDSDSVLVSWALRF